MGDGPTNVKAPRRRVLGAAGEAACVEAIEGVSTGRTWVIGRSTTIGRTSRVDIVLSDDGVSRNHARLSVSEDGLVNVVDLGSTNGTFVNGNRVEVAALRPGDRIGIGPDVVLLFAYRNPALVSAPVQPPLELSPREFEVAVLVAEGLTNAQIGERLHISGHTVATHLKNVYGRVEVGSRAALARLIAQGRLVARARGSMRGPE